MVLVKKLLSVEDSNLPTQLCKKWLKTGEGDPRITRAHQVKIQSVA